ncbi:MAG: quinol:electron acceptor oxidoreductase subunit ActD [Calditrichia bacterium]
MGELSLKQINNDVLSALKRTPSIKYYLMLLFLAGGIGTAWFALLIQVRSGMVVAGINHPVGWGVYIGNFVFWIGIAHSGTLISAILHLVRAKWRDTISRSAEAMTLVAIATAGSFPLIHLGRLWVFYYVLPYPSQRQIWPNFASPLVLDMVAVLTYLTVSLLFFYVGLIPDLAAARERMKKELGPHHVRSRIYRRLSLGWSGAASQWHHYGRAYLFFAALATPLVVSVHSVVSWDFANSLLPGWHTTLYAPYFVAGAIHSGLAMVLTLVIPMRKLLKLEEIIPPKHIERVAQTIIVTSAILAYSYISENFSAWFTGSEFELQFIGWRAGGPTAWIYWLLIPLNILFPLTFVFRRVRKNMILLFIISILINMGMWLERFHIVTSSTAHDYLPHAWGSYAPSAVEIFITLGSFAFFFFFFLAFTKTLPTVPMADYKEHHIEEEEPEEQPCASTPSHTGLTAKTNVVAVYSALPDLLAAIPKVCKKGFTRIEAFSPVKSEELQKILGRGKSPVRFWTLIGAISGLAGGFTLALGTAFVNNLIVGGKHPDAIIIYCVVGFEGTILIGSIANFLAMLFHTRLFKGKTVAGYRPEFTDDKFGLMISCHRQEMEAAKAALQQTGPGEIHVNG